MAFTSAICCAVVSGIEACLCCSFDKLCLTLCYPMDWACWDLSFTISQSLRPLMPVDLVMPFNRLMLCHPLLLMASIFPRIRVFSSELVFFRVNLSHLRGERWHFGGIHIFFCMVRERLCLGAYSPSV